MQLDFLPYAVPGNGDCVEPGSPLYTIPVDEPKILLVNLQLIGPDNYTVWAQVFRQALVTKYKDGFLNAAVSFPTVDQLQ